LIFGGGFLLLIWRFLLSLEAVSNEWVETRDTPGGRWPVIQIHLSRRRGMEKVIKGYLGGLKTG
jgi:hypothetical protein